MYGYIIYVLKIWKKLFCLLYLYNQQQQKNHEKVIFSSDYKKKIFFVKYRKLTKQLKKRCKLSRKITDK